MKHIQSPEGKAIDIRKRKAPQFRQSTALVLWTSLSVIKVCSELIKTVRIVFPVMTSTSMLRECSDKLLKNEAGIIYI
ncbi:hypothetical protein QA612_05355 [Evansella sp. AB-P1]|uniref:hypothetical protein n=1 Tax=Evansella sp. AB-P1 TaxID=3037653 RepID=UPI00241C7E6A|nr:hypothetical protein [Evansella sp. AB-P1]MDG5786910.1 hypothetical protein [Evansella sp. AB-P1]